MPGKISLLSSFATTIAQKYRGSGRDVHVALLFCGVNRHGFLRT